uniref:Uncharacterized protein n=1 Tax=viral metagenome TaxID=1070528 RepID=A0A6C0C0M9_9ZZZZ
MDLHSSVGTAWLDLSNEEQRALSRADLQVQKVALRTAAAVAHTLRNDDLEGRPICARKGEKDVLEQAAKELRVLVLRTGEQPHAMDGQIPLTVETGFGLIGIEVKSGQNTISTEEVNKFRADLVMGTFVVGLFVSHRASICKIPKGIHVQHELSLLGAIPCIFVSPPGQDMMQPLIRSGLALACTMAKRSHRHSPSVDGEVPPEMPGKVTEEHKRDLEQLGSLIREEVAALSITRKRLRDEEEVFHKRVDRASEALIATQQRLAQAVASLKSSKATPALCE